MKQKFPKLDGTYFADDIVEIEQTLDVLERFPDGKIPIGQFMGKINLDSIVEKPDGIWESHQVHYKVTERWDEHPFRVRIENAPYHPIGRSEAKRQLRQQNMHRIVKLIE